MIRRRFRVFGPEQAAGPHGSPLYAALCRGLADDAPTCEMLLAASPGQRIPNLLFAAVHDRLLAGDESEPLAAYYPSVRGKAAVPPDDRAHARFRDFCAQHREPLLRTIATHATQTNEPRRAVALVPALSVIATTERTPIALLEAGTSAGLLLAANRYRIEYDGTATGPPDARLTLGCRVIGAAPALPERVPIAWRAGIDLQPLDVDDPVAVRWLRACLWPEHSERARDLAAAVAVARAVAPGDRPIVVRGDMVDDLAGLAARVPTDAALVVFHFTALVYLDPARRRALVDAVHHLAVSAGRRTWLVGCESIDLFARLGRDLERDLLAGIPGDTPPGPACAIVAWRMETDGSVHHRLLGTVHPHGRWIRWIGGAPG